MNVFPQLLFYEFYKPLYFHVKLFPPQYIWDFPSKENDSPLKDHTPSVEKNPKYFTTWCIDFTWNSPFEKVCPFKGIFSNRQFQTSLCFFKHPGFFAYSELHCNSLPIQQLSRKQHIFGKRDNSLLLGMNSSQSF